MTVCLLEGRVPAVSLCCGEALVLNRQSFEDLLRFEKFLDNEDQGGGSALEFSDCSSAVD